MAPTKRTMKWSRNFSPRNDELGKHQVVRTDRATCRSCCISPYSCQFAQILSQNPQVRYSYKWRNALWETRITAQWKMTTLRCRHFFSFRASHSPHTSFRCRGGVTEACAFRQLRGTGSIPVHGSNKTNDEVVAKLLTWKWRARKTSSSQDRQGNLSVLLHFALFMSIFARRGGAI